MTTKKTYAKPMITDLGSVAALTLSHVNSQGTDAFLNSLPGHPVGPQVQPNGSIIGS